MASGEDTSGSNMPNDDLDVENEEKLKKQHELFQTDQTILTRTLIGRNIFQLKEGDHIGWRRIGYWHHAIYISVNEAGFEVIHFTKTKTICKKNVHKKEGNDLDKEKCDKNENDQSMNVISENIMNTNETNKELYCFNYPQTILDKNPAKIVIERAKAALREPQSYCLLRNNCEHFATYCKTGKGFCCQTLCVEGRVKHAFTVCNQISVVNITAIYAKHDPSKHGQKAMSLNASISSSAQAGSKAMEATSSVSKSARAGSKAMEATSSVSKSARAGSKAMEATSYVSKSARAGSKAIEVTSSVSKSARAGSKTIEATSSVSKSVRAGSKAMEATSSVSKSARAGSKAIETTSYVSSSARAGSKAMEATSSVSRSATIGSKVMKGSSSVSSSARAGSKAMEATSSVSRSTKIGSKVMKGSSSVSRYSRNGSKTMDTANKLGRRNTFFKGVNAVSSIFTLGLIAHNEVQATRKDFEKYKQVFDKKEISKDDYNRLCQGRVTASVVGGAATFAGDYFGFKAGGILGAKIGAFGGAVGATVGAVIGGFGGCCLGYMMGQSVGEKILPVIPDNTRDVQYLHDVDESDSWRFTDEPGSWRDLMKRRGPPHPYSPIHIDIQTTDLIYANGGHMPQITQLFADDDETSKMFQCYILPVIPISADAQRRNGITMDSNMVMRMNGEVVEFKTWKEACADFLKWLKRRERPVLVSEKCGPLSLRILISACESIDQENALLENIHGMVYYTRYLHDVDESDSWRFTDEPGSWQNLMKVGVSPPPYSPIHIDIQTTDLIYASDGHIPQITQLVAVDETSKPFQCYIRPVIPISDDAQRRNGITMDSNKVMRMNGEVVEFQTWTKASADFLEWLKRLDRPVLVSKKFGHISFMILISAYERIGQKNALLENIHGMVYYTRYE
ncbi:uncharacterized protein LOC128239771 isoform X2 [Mya arenaria]|uniref:uncharacterized protein LOC128239771 isoform X2 n=1 Tax=Mya arenaria TaxID=6604 RepID=UPI0022E290B3|nr:uncharacterized protein LOC128239771 isoform X2 [Mya arenaria]